MKMVLWALVTLALLASMVRAQSPVCRLQKCKLIGHDLTSRRDTYNYEIEGNTIEIINYKFGAPVLEVHCKGSNVLGSPALPRFNPTLHVQKITLENCPLPATNLGHTFATLNVTFCESVIPENPCELSLNDVPIEQLSTKHFFGLERLQVLKVNNFNLKSNEQMSVGCDFLTVLNSLRELRISYAAMPIEFTLPPFLETLSLESTGTERLPEVIPSSLTYINVKGDNLLNARAVPPGLRQLYLGSSATSLKFDKAPALEMLWMVKWTELLPQPVMACSVLREIYLEAASMRTLPDSWLVNCTSLVDIEITGAKNLTTLPLTLFAPGGPLTRLVLRHGSLETLPEGLLHHLPNLEILDLHNNRLRTIPITSFSWLHRLLSVDISSNDVDGSVLEAVANKSLRRWLNDVNLSNNPRIGDLCSESYRGENGYSRLYNVRYLHELWLGWTNVTRICRDWRERMDKLEMLDLRNTSITELTVTGQTCNILKNALERYAFVLRSTDRIARYLARQARRRRSLTDVKHRGYVEQLQVDLTAPCETHPYFGMDESYELVVSSVSRLTSPSVWGILRGLESWLQLFYISDDDPDIRINKTSIQDSPRYPHRGLHIDTARHYISLSKIQTTLEAMAMNKMNVLHWHMVDDQSFPYQSVRFPELSQRGAYHRSLVYTQRDIQMIINYARNRGIRVVPEFDVPVRMLRTLLFVGLCVFTSAEEYAGYEDDVGPTVDLFGPKYKPTKGAIWPQPKQQVIEDIYYTFNPKYFINMTVTGQTCNILKNALERYAFVLRSTDRIARYLARQARRRRSLTDVKHRGYVEQLQVDLTAPCETHPYFGMDESYELVVSSVSRLTSPSVWGILRGLESWLQLFYISDDDPDIRINKTSIQDSPRYPHRGLHIDTARHYISLSKIQTTLEAMAMNKMNVLHWHMVDDQSFPYQSVRFPELSQRGAYHRSLVYTQRDIQMIINYARNRGIRVVPEFDVPGHTRSWGESHPEVLTPCYRGERVVGLGPMNPINNATYRLLRELITELQTLFPDKYFHVGGDEVDLRCWESNPELLQYMREHHMKSVEELHALFMRNVFPLLGPRSTPIVWQEVFDEGVPLPAGTLVQVWKDNDITRILDAGYNVVYSTAWYLDHLSSGGDWEKLYMAEPSVRRGWWWGSDELGKAGGLRARVVGGEACMWAEVVDDRNFLSRIWPRASAVAERLWSPAPGRLYSVPMEVYSRLEEHYCRMNRRGVPAQPPSGPGVCLGATT